MKVTFYYVRHGKTLFNETGRVQGRCDSPLTEEGIHGAEDTASALRNCHFDHAYCSSSERAWVTAQKICSYHNMEPVCMKGLKEFDFGDLDGEIAGGLVSKIWGDHMVDDWTAYHGESLEQFDKRTRKAFGEIIDHCHDNDRVLIVSHGSFLMHLMKTLLNVDQKAYAEKRNKEGKVWVPNCGICVFTYEDGSWSMSEEPMTADEWRIKHDPKTVHFYYVRHGETLFNKKHVLQGQCDSPLTDKGIQQAEDLAEKLKDVPFNHAYISVSERARDTADIILKNRDVPVQCDKRLKEVFYGRLEGTDYTKNRDDIFRRHLAIAYKDVGGEDREDVALRMKDCLRDMTDASKSGDNVLIAGHGDYYLSMLEIVFGLNRKDIYDKAEKEHRNPMPNAGIFRFTYENGSYHIDSLMEE
ncbi:MAG: histidine phosphatase family protein [Erysipelotrichaceae bacterium]|nr:histidine phosphatase family protein [Erysipelotrichaceae bacterium]